MTRSKGVLELVGEPKVDPRFKKRRALWSKEASAIPKTANSHHDFIVREYTDMDRVSNDTTECFKVSCLWLDAFA